MILLDAAALPDWLQFVPHAGAVALAIMISPSATKIIIAIWQGRKKGEEGGEKPRDRAEALLTDMKERHRDHADRDEEAARDLARELSTIKDTIRDSHAKLAEGISRVEVGIENLKAKRGGS